MAFAAVVVAVHNRALHHWLQEAKQVPMVDWTHWRRDSARTAVSSEHFPALTVPYGGSGADPPCCPGYILEPGALIEQILEAVRQALA